MSTTTRKPAAVTAVYCRISADRNDKTQGVDRQRDDCRAHAKRKGWSVAAEYIDNDISASAYTRKVRPQYRAMLEEIRAGRISRVVVWHVDRLYRQVTELEELIKLADAGKVEIVSVTGGELDLGTSDGRMVARVLVSVASKSSEDTSRRITRQKLDRREHGQPHGGPRPFGWKDQLTPHPQESKVLVAAMNDVLRGKTLGAVAREWSAAKVRGRAWGVTDLARALTAPRHAGRIVHDGVDVGPAAWKALIDPERFEELRAVIAARGERTRGIPRRRSLLTGILRCGRCGGAMTRSVGNGAPIWVCRTARGPKGCGVRVQAALIEPIIIEATWQFTDALDLAKMLNAGDPKTSERARIIKQLHALDEREKQAGSMFAKGTIKARGFEQATRLITAEHDELQRKLASLSERDTLSKYASRPGALRAVWDTLTMDAQREIISESLKSIAIMPARSRGHFDVKRIVLGAPRKARRTA